MQRENPSQRFWLGMEFRTPTSEAFVFTSAAHDIIQRGRDNGKARPKEDRLGQAEAIDRRNSPASAKNRAASAETVVHASKPADGTVLGSEQLQLLLFLERFQGRPAVAKAGVDPVFRPKMRQRHPCETAPGVRIRHRQSRRPGSSIDFTRVCRCRPAPWVRPRRVVVGATAASGCSNG
jgi:hypothetical protein